MSARFPFARVWRNGAAGRGEAQKRRRKSAALRRLENRSKDTFVCVFAITLLSRISGVRDNNAPRNASRLLLKLKLHRFIGRDIISALSRADPPSRCADWDITVGREKMHVNSRDSFRSDISFGITLRGIINIHPLRE